MREMICSTWSSLKQVKKVLVRNLPHEALCNSIRGSFSEVFMRPCKRVGEEVISPSVLEVTEWILKHWLFYCVDEYYAQQEPVKAKKT
jgi:hypothetical protein